MTANEKVPFLDLVTPHKELQQELTAVFQQVISTGGFVGGPLVENFEKDFATFCDAKFCVGVSSGTDAVRFALTAAGVEPGDIVVTVPHTFIATTEGISQAGAHPHFVDIDDVTYTMSPKRLQEYLDRECEIVGGKTIHKKTKKHVSAIVPVHIYGQCADMDPLMEIADKYKLIIVEDACQAHGAEYFSKKQNKWLKAGSIGAANAFSFYPGKNLGACGEGGAITTNDPEMVRKMKMLREHGQVKKYYHDIEGYNGRLDSLQAGLLHVKLRHLAEWNKQRQAAAAEYKKLLASNTALKLPVVPEWSRPVWHLFVVRVADRDGLQKRLAEAKIDTGIHYPIPLHLQNAYKSLGHKNGDFPVTEKLALEILSLPMYPQLQKAQQARVAQAVEEILSVPSV